MKLITNGFVCLLISSAILSGSVFASGASDKYQHNESKYKNRVFKNLPVASQNRFRINVAGGIAKLDGGNSQLGVTSSETDTLVQTNSNSWNTPGARLGVGYIYYIGDSLQYHDNVQWFTSVEPQLNLYYLTTNSIKGNVLRFGSPDHAELNFDVPFHSLRAMLDVALTVTSWKKLSLYGLAGIGYANNRVSYSDSPSGSAPCTLQPVSLGTKNNNNFVWEAGAGLDFAFNSHFSLFIEYLYTDLGKVEPSGSGSAGTITSPVLTVPQFHVKAQTALLGIKIGF